MTRRLWEIGGIAKRPSRQVDGNTNQIQGPSKLNGPQTEAVKRVGGPSTQHSPYAELKSEKQVKKSRNVVVRLQVCKRGSIHSKRFAVK